MRIYLDPKPNEGGTPAVSAAAPPAAAPAAPAAPAAAAAATPAPTLTAEQIAAQKAAESTVTPSATAPVIPEKYDIKLPEGSPLDPKAVQEVAEYAKAHKLTNDQAQEVLKRDGETVARFVKEGQENLKANAAKFLTEAKTDPEIGGDNFEKNVELGKRVIDKFGSPRLKQILNETGLGNHPELVRLVTKIGMAYGEDKLVVGTTGPTSKEEKSAASVLYDKKA